MIDAKSIMGIFSLDLSKPIDLNIHADTAEIDTILDALKAALCRCTGLSLGLTSRRL